jgi:hypothetical protein
MLSSIAFKFNLRHYTEEGRITNTRVLVCDTPYSVTALQAADAPSLSLACGFDTSQVTTGTNPPFKVGWVVQVEAS